MRSTTFVWRPHLSVSLLVCVLLCVGGALGRGGSTTAGCTRTRGYWCTHHCRAGRDDTSPRRLSWPPADASDACAVEDSPFLCPDLTAYGVCELSEAGGNIWSQSATQLRTYINNRATEAGAPSDIETVADALESILIQYCAAKDFPHDDPQRALAEEYKTYLDTYNNGQWPDAPNHCDDGNEYPCVFYSWSEWTACSAVCVDEGSGIRNRTRTIVCPGEPDEVVAESEPCSTDEPCCAWNAWGEWSTCSGTCAEETGVRTRMRTLTCSHDPSATDTESEELACNRDVPCCEWSCWSPYSECSEVCGDEGTRGRTRLFECVNDDPRNGRDQSEVEECNRVPCCEPEETGAWSPCSVECGSGGTRSRLHVQVCLDSGVHYRTETEPCSAAHPCCPDNCAECDGQGACLQCEPHHYGPHCEFSPCVECLPHRYGPQCVRCPDACPEACHDGLTGDGSCL